MLTEASTKKETTKGKWQWVLAVLGVGICIGAIVDPYSWARAWFTSTARSARNLDANGDLSERVQPVVSATAIDYGLETLSITVTEQHVQLLQWIRNQGLQMGSAQQGKALHDGEVSATVTFRGKPYSAQIRVEENWPDLITAGGGSLRIQLHDGMILEMSEFSIQHPQARNTLRGWLVLKALRELEDVLAPRTSYLNLIINDKALGVCKLEEHLNKQLLESQGRRPGPIIKFEEDLAPLAHFEYPLMHRTDAEDSVVSWDVVDKANPVVFGITRLTRVDPFVQQLDEVLAQLGAVQRAVVAALGQRDRATALLTRAAVQDQAIEAIFDVELNAAAHAITSVLANKHPLTWDNARFYRNPVTSKLEPVIFAVDNRGYDSEQLPVIWDGPFVCQMLLKNTHYSEAFFRYLARYCEDTYLDDMLVKLGPELYQYERALEAEGLLSGAHRVPQLVNDFRQRQQYLRELLEPRVAVSFSAIAYDNDPPDRNHPAKRGPKMIEVEAWTHTPVPVVVEGFRFDNGHRVGALLHVATNERSLGDGVILPLDGSRVTFRFAADLRLVGLNKVQRVKQAVRNRIAIVPDSVQPVWALWHSTATKQVQERMLLPRHIDWAWRAAGRTEAPALHQALERHPMLIYDVDQNRLVMRRGDWTFHQDLHLPAGYTLQVGPGTTLRFVSEAALIAEGPLNFEGTEQDPITLEPAEGHGHFNGVVVIEAASQSRWAHVIVRQARPVERGWWILTGGVTFYKSPVDLYHTRIESAYGEDALNIFGGDFHMESVTMDGADSDLFDGDFVHGTIRDSFFNRCGQDAIDLSGSNVQIQDCRFGDVGDKCLSVGENSSVRVRNVTAEQAGIGVAVKDLSKVEIENFQLSRATHYGVAVYVKKPEYGASSVQIKDLVLGECGRDRILVQKGNTVVVEGVEQPTQVVNVDDLYRRRILGQ